MPDVDVLSIGPSIATRPVAAGDEVVLREVWRGRFLAARPVRVVETTATHVAFSLAPGTAWKNDPRDHGDVRFLDGPWALEDAVLERPVLSFSFPDRAYAVILIWDDGRLRHHYVNIESPLRAWDGGFDYSDWFLDVVIAPDRASYRWKDEDEVLHAIDRGLMTPAHAEAARAAGERAIEHVLGGEPPFDRDWSGWEPDPAWPLPLLPDDWDAAPPG